jgi:hypothetical protein
MNMRLFLSEGIEGCGKISHHFIPLLRESLLKQQIDRIVCSVVFLFFHHGGFIGHERSILFNRDKIETQLSILGPRQGHALKKK